MTNRLAPTSLLTLTLLACPPKQAPTDPIASSRADFTANVFDLYLGRSSGCIATAPYNVQTGRVGECQVYCAGQSLPPIDGLPLSFKLAATPNLERQRYELLGASCNQDSFKAAIDAYNTRQTDN